jgi:tetratricopeptide (TPR) repeat protein
MILKKFQFLCIVSTFLLISNSWALTNEELACNDFLNKGDAEKALQQADKVLKADSKSASALICRGRALNLQEKPELAIQAFKQVEASTQDAYDRTVALILTGNTLKRINKFTEAIQSYENALALSSKYQQLKLFAYTSIGDTYDAMSNLDKALEAYKNAQALSANDGERGETASKIASTYVKLKQYDLAVENQVQAYLMMEKSGTLDQYAQASVALGKNYLLNKNYEIAEKTLNKIINFAKERGGAFYEAQGSYVLAMVKAAQNDKESAKKLVEHAKKIALETKDEALKQEIEQETKAIF